jgi:hypothetical protein
VPKLIIIEIEDKTMNGERLKPGVEVCSEDGEEIHLAQDME